FDPGRQYLRRCGLFHKRWCRAVDGVELFRLYWPPFIHRIASHVEYAAHDAFAHRDGNRLPGVRNFKSTFEPLCARHGHGSHPSVSEVLLHFECKTGELVLNPVLAGKCVVDSRKRAGEFNIDYRSEYLNDLSFV